MKANLHNSNLRKTADSPLGQTVVTRILSHFTGLSRIQKRSIQVAIDSFLIIFCFATAMTLRLEGLEFATDPQSWTVMFPVLALTIIAFVKLGLYRAIVRYISGRALKVVFLGVLLSTLVMSLSVYLFELPVPRAVPAIYGVLLFLSVGGSRFLARALIMQHKVREKTPVLIYGAGETGRRLAATLRQGLDYDPVAFIDDDKALEGSIVIGLRIESPSRIRKLMSETRAGAIFLAMPGIGRARRREIIATLEPLAIEVRSFVAGADERRGKIRIGDLRRIAPEDLLGRDPIAPREEMMTANITDKVVLVSGAGGTIGSELCRQILMRRPRSLVLLDVSEYALYRISEKLALMMEHQTQDGPAIVPVLGSVQNPGRMRAILKSYGVQTVYHAAAYKHVPMIEENVVEGVRNNVFGTRTLAQAAAETGVENFILVSSDKAVRPSNVMGATKRMAELICQDMAHTARRTRFSMVRFGNVLGSSGSVIPRFREQIERGGPVTVTHREITRFFMTITEAAQLVIQAGAMARGGDVFVLDMGEPVKIFDLARSMIRLHGLEPYVIESDADMSPVRGDIGIRITGPRKGEKLYEELLVGDNPTGTEHPRILTANEARLESDQLEAFLSRLFQACLDYDIPAIRGVFLEAPLAYNPTSDEVEDLTWQATASRRAASPGRATLRVVEKKG